MSKQVTKDELVAKLAIEEQKEAELLKAIETLQEDDKRIRANFTNILIGRKTGDNNFYGISMMERKAEIFSWLTIASEVGKLMVDRDIEDQKERLENFVNNTAAFEERVNKKLFSDTGERVERDRNCDCEC